MASSAGEIVDPHTAVGLGAAQRCRRITQVPMVTLATAHPAKFPDAIVDAVGHGPDVPERLAAVAELDEHFDVLANDLDQVESYILERIR